MIERDPAPDARGGGCFFVVTLLGGFLFGLSMNEPLKGTLLGLAAGIVIAGGVWLIDRRR